MSRASVLAIMSVVFIITSPLQHDFTDAIDFATNVSAAATANTTGCKP
jgi:hypothetical protein